MQIACSLAVALLFVLTGSCSQTRGAPPDLLEPSQYQMSYEERLRLEIAAPLIVVGRVTTVHSIGPPTRSRGDQRVLIQLTKISVNVEVVVKGDLKTPSVDFYYYLFSEKNERYLGRKRYEPVVGDRRLLPHVFRWRVPSGRRCFRLHVAGQERLPRSGLLQW